MKNDKPPVEENDIIDVEIMSIGEKGDGIAKINNFVIIVPNTVVDEQTKVKVTKVLNTVAFAEKIE